MPEQTSLAAGDPLVLDLGGPADVLEVSAELADVLADQQAGPLIMTWSYGTTDGEAGTSGDTAPSVVRVGGLEVVVVPALPDGSVPSLTDLAGRGPWSGEPTVVRTVLVVADPRPAVIPEHRPEENLNEPHP